MRCLSKIRVGDALRLRFAVALLFLLPAVLSIIACDKITLPRMGFEQSPVNVVPVTVRVVLEAPVRDAVLSQSVCDNQVWEGRLGPILADKIHQIGNSRVRQTIVTSSVPAPDSGTGPKPDYQVLLRLANLEMVGKDRTGGTDQYQARMELGLLATYQAALADGTFHTLGEGPLQYRDNFSVFTPRLGQAGGRCLTNSLDNVLAKASERIADQLFSVMAQRLGPEGERTAPLAAHTTQATVASTPPPGSTGLGRTATEAVRPAPLQPAASRSTSTPSTRTAPDDPTYAVIIGIRSYRDPWPTRQPSADLGPIIRTLHESVGVPLDHLMVLEDELANRLDIEEALTQWLAARATAQCVVYVYFVGQAALDSQSGEVYLAPYDASSGDPPTRFLSLRRLQTHLSRTNARLGLVFIDAPLTPLTTRPTGKDQKTSTRPSPNWRGNLNADTNGQGVVLQFSRNGSVPPDAAHLLDGLTGGADLDQDGQVTVGELLKSLKSSTITAPLVSASSPALKIVLSRTK